ncbi:hypothetical protein AAP_06390 [Ascosphaera apis ARSEF 7405]|uniref:DDE Tnp4 domain-containing protein n=1 Tax=Ascosphaera apis ARSEF 7405 TaxID=392613 RepID=A0A167UUJ7_9EURO|nr:hypothetical protein AAP_06390 [Ascosphaera apis ARSEF 7405]
MFIYGDAAYTSSRATMGPWRRPARGELTPEKREFNYRLSKKRVAVENFFSMVQNSWELGIMRTSHRVGSSPVALVFAAGAFLENCKSCIRGTNQVSVKFGVPPPSIDEYLASLMPRSEADSTNTDDQEDMVWPRDLFTYEELGEEVREDEDERGEREGDIGES